MLGKRTASFSFDPPAGKRTYRQTHFKPYQRKYRGKRRGYQPDSYSSLNPNSAELKHFDVGLARTSLDTPSSSTNPTLYHVLTVCNMGQGDAGAQRNGNRIQLDKISIRGKCEVAPTSGVTSSTLSAIAHLFRVVMYYDSSPNGAGVSWQTLMETDPSNSGQTYVYNNIHQTGRFKILMDKWVLVDAAPGVLFDGDTYHCYGQSKFYKTSVSLKGLQTWYSDGNTNLSSIQRGNIGVFICSDSNSSTEANMQFSFRTRLRYRDY